jgi:F-type H+-transporting ATPase subunit beta
MGNKTSPSNSGVVVSVRGSVVDIRFDAHLPPIYSLLHAQEGEIAIEVLAQLDAPSPAAARWKTRADR